MAKFCAECGSALTDGDVFCVSCGARVAPATVVPAAPVPPAPPPAPAPGPTAAPAAGRAAPGSVVGRLKWEIVLGVIAGAASAFLGSRELLGASFVGGFAAAFVAVLLAHVVVSFIGRIARPLGPVAALLLFVGGTASAASYYVNAPDTPGGISRYVPDIGAIVADLTPYSNDPLRPVTVPKPPPPPAVAAAADAGRVAQLTQQIRASGLPVTSVLLVEAPDGQQALVVAMPFDKLVSGLNQGFGVAESVDAYVKLAQLKTLDLKGLGYLTTAVVDEQGRPILSVSAPAGAIDSFRSGTSTRRDLIRAIAFKGESRAGLLDAVKRQFGP